MGSYSNLSNLNLTDLFPAARVRNHMGNMTISAMNGTKSEKKSPSYKVLSIF